MTAINLLKEDLFSHSKLCSLTFAHSPNIFDLHIFFHVKVNMADLGFFFLASVGAI